MPHWDREIGRISGKNGDNGSGNIRQIGGPGRRNSIIWYSNHPVNLSQIRPGAFGPILQRLTEQLLESAAPTGMVRQYSRREFG